MKFSIVQNKKECYVCKTTYGLHFHHIHFGTANRKLSDEDGLTVWLCLEHHTGNTGIHFNKDLDLYLKVLSEKRWCEFYNKTPEQFRIRYGKNYL